MTSQQLISETALCDLPDRIVVSPGHGRLIVSSPRVVTTEGEVVRAGDVVALVEAPDATIEVRSPCDAWVLGFLAAHGERVRPGMPIVHVREL